MAITDWNDDDDDYRGGGYSEPSDDPEPADPPDDPEPSTDSDSEPDPGEVDLFYSDVQEDFWEGVPEPVAVAPPPPAPPAPAPAPPSPPSITPGSDPYSSDDDDDVVVTTPIASNISTAGSVIEILSGSGPSNIVTSTTEDNTGDQGDIPPAPIVVAISPTSTVRAPALVEESTPITDLTPGTIPEEDPKPLSDLDKVIATRDPLAVFAAEEAGTITSATAAGILTGWKRQSDEVTSEAKNEFNESQNEALNSMKSSSDTRDEDGNTNMFEQELFTHVKGQWEAEQAKQAQGIVTGVEWKTIQELSDFVRGQLQEQAFGQFFQNKAHLELVSGKANLEYAVDVGVDINKITTPTYLGGYGYSPEDLNKTLASINLRDNIIYNHGNDVVRAFNNDDDVNTETLAIRYSSDYISAVNKVSIYKDEDGGLDPLQAVASTIEGAPRVSEGLGTFNVLTPSIGESILEEDIAKSLSIVLGVQPDPETGDYSVLPYVSTLIEVKDYINISTNEDTGDKESSLDIEQFVRDNIENKESALSILETLGYQASENYFDSIVTKVKREKAEDILEETLGEDLDHVGKTFFETYEDIFQIVDGETEHYTEERNTGAILTSFIKNHGGSPETSLQVLKDYGFNTQSLQVASNLLEVKDYIEDDGSLDIFEISKNKVSQGFSNQEVLKTLQDLGASDKDSQESLLWANATVDLEKSLGQNIEDITPIEAINSNDNADIAFRNTATLFGEDVAFSAYLVRNHLDSEGNLNPSLAISKGLAPGHLRTLGLPDRLVDNVVNLNQYFDASGSYNIHNMVVSGDEDSINSLYELTPENEHSNLDEAIQESKDYLKFYEINYDDIDFDIVRQIPLPGHASEEFGPQISELDPTKWSLEDRVAAHRDQTRVEILEDDLEQTGKDLAYTHQEKLATVAAVGGALSQFIKNPIATVMLVKDKLTNEEVKSGAQNLRDMGLDTLGDWWEGLRNIDVNDLLAAQGEAFREDVARISGTAEPTSIAEAAIGTGLVMSPLGIPMPKSPKDIDPKKLGRFRNPGAAVITAIALSELSKDERFQQGTLNVIDKVFGESEISDNTLKVVELENEAGFVGTRIKSPDSPGGIPRVLAPGETRLEFPGELTSQQREMFKVPGITTIPGLEKGTTLTFPGVLPEIFREGVPPTDILSPDFDPSAPPPDLAELTGAAESTVPGGRYRQLPKHILAMSVMSHAVDNEDLKGVVAGARGLGSSDDDIARQLKDVVDDYNLRGQGVVGPTAWTDTSPAIPLRDSGDPLSRVVVEPTARQMALDRVALQQYWNETIGGPIPDALTDSLMSAKVTNDWNRAALNRFIANAIAENATTEYIRSVHGFNPEQQNLLSSMVATASGMVEGKPGIEFSNVISPSVIRPSTGISFNTDISAAMTNISPSAAPGMYPQISPALETALSQGLSIMPQIQGAQANAYLTQAVPTVSVQTKPMTLSLPLTQALPTVSTSTRTGSAAKTATQTATQAATQTRTAVKTATQARSGTAARTSTAARAATATAAAAAAGATTGAQAKSLTKSRSITKTLKPAMKPKKPKGAKPEMDEKYMEANKGGAVAWKQGLFWVEVYPPYGEDNFNHSMSSRAKYKVKDAKAAVRKIQKLGGVIEKDSFDEWAYLFQSEPVSKDRGTFKLK